MRRRCDSEESARGEERKGQTEQLLCINLEEIASDAIAKSSAWSRCALFSFNASNHETHDDNTLL